MSDQIGEGLAYSVRPRVIAKYFGQLCLMLAIINVVPLVTSMLFREPLIAARYVIVIAIYLVLGFIFARIKIPRNMQTNEGMVLIVVTMIVTCLITSYPIMGLGLSFTNALFEVISSITATGLSTITTVVDAPRSLLFERVWMEWYGTLGFVTVAVFLVMSPGLSHKLLNDSQIETKDLAGGTRAHASLIIKVSCVMLAISVLGCWIMGQDPFHALLYGMSASCTGGFAPSDAGIAELNLSLQLWICTMCICAAIPLTIYSRYLNKRANFMIDLMQARTLIIICVCIATAIGCILYVKTNSNVNYLLHNVPILAIQAQTATGFSTAIAPDSLDAGSKLLIIFSMLIGGSVGSTAGGVKILRLLFFINILNKSLKRICMSRHVVVVPKIGNIRLYDENVISTLLLVMLFVVIIFISWLIFLIAGYDPLNSLFEIVSAISTTGLSVGIINESLPTYLKFVLCIDMLFGRIEILAWLLMLYPSTWFGLRLEAE